MDKRFDQSLNVSMHQGILWIGLLWQARVKKEKKEAKEGNKEGIVVISESCLEEGGPIY